MNVHCIFAKVSLNINLEMYFLLSIIKNIFIPRDVTSMYKVTEVNSQTSVLHSILNASIIIKKME